VAVTANGSTTQARYIYDGDQIVLEFEGSGSLGATNLGDRYLWGPAVDQLLADDQLQGTPQVVWTLGDGENTVRDLATYNTGTDVTTVANHRVFSAYGQLLSQTHSSVGCLLAFTGRPLDQATGLQNNLNRWYDAITGRWLSQDPSGFGGGDANLYRYCGNAPAEQIDANGLADVAPVVVWINLKFLPTNFNIGAVQAEMRTILSGAGVKSKLTLILTTNEPKNLPLGYQYDTAQYWGNGSWWGLSPINPAWWITAAGHDIYRLATRKVCSYGQYVHFEQTGLGGMSTVGTDTQVNNANMSNMFNNNEEPQKSWTLVYANCLIHEIYWRGLIGKADDMLFSDRHTLPSGDQSFTYPMTRLSEYAGSINRRLE